MKKKQISLKSKLLFSKHIIARLEQPKGGIAIVRYGINSGAGGTVQWPTNTGNGIVKADSCVGWPTNTGTGIV